MYFRKLKQLSCVLIVTPVLIIGLYHPVTADQGISSDPLTLEKAKQIAFENNPTIASAMEKINQAKESVSQARAGYLPSVTSSVGWNYTEKTTNSSPIFDETQYSARISATQTLFDGFYTKYSVLAAQHNQGMNIASHEDKKRLLSWAVANAYLNTLLAEESIKTAQSDMDFNKKQEKDAIAKKTAGQGSYSDVLNFRTRVNTAASSLLSAQQDLNEAKTSLAALMGVKDAKFPNKFTMAPLGTISKTESLNTESFFEDSLSSRPDLEAKLLSIKEAEANLESVKASYFPKVSLTASYGANSGDYFLDDSDMGAAMEISVSFDIFSGGVRKSKQNQARSRKIELENNLADAKIDATADIRTSIQNIDTLRQQLALQGKNTELIKTTRDLVEKEYRAGQTSLVRLNEAQNDLVTAKGKLSMSKASLILALEELDYYIGNNFD